MKKFNLIAFLLITALFLSCKNSADSENSKTVVDFKWDFSKARNYIYKYFQEVDSESQMWKSGDATHSKLIGDGFIVVKSKGDKTADLSFVDLQMQMITFEDGKPKDTLSNKAPEQIIPGMNEKGEFKDEGINILFKILFPLPSRPLKVGETEKIPMKIPFNAYGTKLWATGFNALTYEKNGELDGKKCAVIKAVIDISDLDIPEGIKGTYKMVTKGTATYYFDYINHYYLGADINLTMDVLADGDMFMKMKNDNIFKIRFDRIEE